LSHKFIGISMLQLSGRQNLRDIESNLKYQQEKRYHYKVSLREIE